MAEKALEAGPCCRCPGRAVLLRRAGSLGGDSPHALRSRALCGTKTAVERRPSPPPAHPWLTCLPPFLSVPAPSLWTCVVPGVAQTTGNVWLTHEEMETLAAAPHTVSRGPSCPPPSALPPRSRPALGLVVENKNVILR